MNPNYFKTYSIMPILSSEVDRNQFAMVNTHKLTIISWNVRGLSDPNQKVILKNWLGGLHKKIDILMLQELKADDFRLEVALAYILPSYQTVTSYPKDGCGGTTLLIHPSIDIINSGVTLRGAAWAEIRFAQNQYFVASIYAPNTALERKNLWNALTTTTPDGKWIIAGDYNMVEQASDSTSNSPLLTGEELEEWRLLKLKLSLKDAAHIKRITGPKYTRRGTLDDKLVQSRLDRFYFSEWGTWLQDLHEIKHHTTSYTL
jgi:exonuclease III